MPDELFRANANVLDDLTQDDRREVARTMVGHGCLPAVGVPKLAVGPALAHLCETKLFQNTNRLAGLQYRQKAHDYTVTA